jgi:Tol biopolymer transport system component
MMSMARWSRRCLGILAVVAGAGCDSTEPRDPDPPAPVPTLFDRIIFARNDPARCADESCPFGLWTMAPDGTDLRLLRDSLNYPEHPSVSPDGRTVVVEDGWSLFLMDADGHAFRHLETGLSSSLWPAWTPDGAWVLFVGIETADRPPQIYRIRVDGSDREQVTTAEGLGADNPALSRDGRYLAYIARTFNAAPGEERSWVVVRDLTDGDERIVTDSSFAGWSASWSPDASTLLFLDSDPFSTDWALWRLTVATGEYTLFGDPRGNRPATYSPDGRTLLFGTHDLWLADSSGQNQRVLLADAALNFEAFWTPASPASSAQ